MVIFPARADFIFATVPEKLTPGELRVISPLVRVLLIVTKSERL